MEQPPPPKRLCLKINKRFSLLLLLLYFKTGVLVREAFREQSSNLISMLRPHRIITKKIFPV